MKQFLLSVRDALYFAGVITALEAIECILRAITAFMNHHPFSGVVTLLAAFGFGVASYRSFYIVRNSTINVVHPKSNPDEDEASSTTHDE